MSSTKENYYQTQLGLSAPSSPPPIPLGSKPLLLAPRLLGLIELKPERSFPKDLGKPVFVFDVSSNPSGILQVVLI